MTPLGVVRAYPGETGQLAARSLHDAGPGERVLVDTTAEVVTAMPFVGDRLREESIEHRMLRMRMGTRYPSTRQGIIDLALSFPGVYEVRIEETKYFVDDTLPAHVIITYRGTAAEHEVAEHLEQARPAGVEFRVVRAAFSAADESLLGLSRHQQ